MGHTLIPIFNVGIKRRNKIIDRTSDEREGAIEEINSGKH